MKANALVVTLGLATTAYADPIITRATDPPKPIKWLREEGARIIATMEEGERFPMVTPLLTPIWPLTSGAIAHIGAARQRTRLVVA